MSQAEVGCTVYAPVPKLKDPESIATHAQDSEKVAVSVWIWAQRRPRRYKGTGGDGGMRQRVGAWSWMVQFLVRGVKVPGSRVGMHWELAYCG